MLWLVCMLLYGLVGWCVWLCAVCIRSATSMWRDVCWWPRPVVQWHRICRYVHNCHIWCLCVSVWVCLYLCEIVAHVWECLYWCAIVVHVWVCLHVCETVTCVWVCLYVCEVVACYKKWKVEWTARIGMCQRSMFTTEDLWMYGPAHAGVKRNDGADRWLKWLSQVSCISEDRSVEELGTKPRTSWGERCRKRQ